MRLTGKSCIVAATFSISVHSSSMHYRAASCGEFAPAINNLLKICVTRLFVLPLGNNLGHFADRGGIEKSPNGQV